MKIMMLKETASEKITQIFDAVLDKYAHYSLINQ